VGAGTATVGAALGADGPTGPDVGLAAVLVLVLVLAGSSAVALALDDAPEGSRRSATVVRAAEAATMTATIRTARFCPAGVIVVVDGGELLAVSPVLPTGGTDTCESPPSGVTIRRELGGDATG
jgi:hypothetical protein